MSKLTPKEIRMITAQLKEKAEPEIKKLNQEEIQKFKLPKELNNFLPKILKYAKILKQEQELRKLGGNLQDEFTELRTILGNNKHNLNYSAYYLSDISTRISDPNSKTLTKKDEESLKTFFYSALNEKQYEFNEAKVERELVLAGISKDFDLEKILNNFKNYIQ